MKFVNRYLGRSTLVEQSSHSALSFVPNIARSPVFFDGEVKHPVEFREAMSALHEVVVGDFRRQRKDRSAYQAWVADQARLGEKVAQAAHDTAYAAELQRAATQPVRANLDEEFRRAHRKYWKARVQWADELMQNDPALFRALVPCDPVVTVTPDTVVFECFSKDESSYGCLSVSRNRFSANHDVSLGTTNVDYSLALFEHFQTLRTYRPTRLSIDPAGFSVTTTGSQAAHIREEKIDLPNSWLRGFGQLQAAMTVPAQSVTLSVDTIYSLLAHLRTHRERTGPRALRFVLNPGHAPTIIIEPWGIAVTSTSAPYQGERPQEIKVWGRRRLNAFARLLPFTSHVDVQLLGTGMPSIWVAHLGEMQFTLALSGWSANDWARGVNLSEYLPHAVADAAAVVRMAHYLRQHHFASLAELQKITNLAQPTLLGSLHELAKRGQLLCDYPNQLFRWRSVVDVELTDAMLGPEPAEIVAGRDLVHNTTIAQVTPIGARQHFAGTVGNTNCEAMLDTDGVISKAKCSCSYFYTKRLRSGPCRHLYALRAVATARTRSSVLPLEN